MQILKSNRVAQTIAQKSISQKPLRPLIAALACIVLFAMQASADERLQLRDICRLKGQEFNRIQGIGLVVGLNGTGDDSIQPTTRALARMMQTMGSSISSSPQGIPDINELEDARNVAVVYVSAEVPRAGAQQGDQLDCTVSAISAKSLAGGRLVLAYMLGPRADVPTVYGVSDGPISIPDPTFPTSGIVYGGCKMESTIKNSFVSNNRITLVLDQDIASFSTAVDIADAINSLNQSGLTGGLGASDTMVGANAIDQLHIEVMIPDAYIDAPVKFVSLVLDLPLPNIKKPKRVVINEREGVIVIGQDVLINPVAINHKNLAVEARAGQGGFVGIDIEEPNTTRPKLKNLVEALNALKVPTEDVIAIIRTLKANGDLYAELIIE